MCAKEKVDGMYDTEPFFYILNVIALCLELVKQDQKGVHGFEMCESFRQ